MCSRILRFSLFVANCEFPFSASWQDQGAFFFVFIWFIESWTFLLWLFGQQHFPVYNSFFFTTHETKTDLLQMKIKDNKSIVPLPFVLSGCQSQTSCIDQDNVSSTAAGFFYLKCFLYFSSIEKSFLVGAHAPFW